MRPRTRVHFRVEASHVYTPETGEVLLEISGYSRINSGSTINPIKTMAMSTTTGLPLVAMLKVNDVELDS